MRNFLTMDSISSDELAMLLDRASELKADRHASKVLTGRSVGMIFEKPSTRTRVSFEVGIAELGGTPLPLAASELQLGRGETIEDTARVLSRYLHALVVRTYEQGKLERLASAGTIPVVNALSDLEHPCQTLADLLTIRERFGQIAGRRVAYVGDGNNVVHSLMVGCALSGATCVVATPAGYAPDAVIVRTAQGLGGTIELTHDPALAVTGADVIYTDVWASMGQEDEEAERSEVFAPFQVNRQLVALAPSHVQVLHCLPAHRGHEITDEVVDGPNADVWNQAENRLHVQKALLEWLLD